MAHAVASIPNGRSEVEVKHRRVMQSMDTKRWSTQNARVHVHKEGMSSTHEQNSILNFVGAYFVLRPLCVLELH